MNKRCLMLGLLSAVLAQGAATAAAADALELVIPTKAGVSPPNAIAEIKVDGESQDGPYDSVRNKTLDYIYSARGDWHKKHIGDPYFGVVVDGQAKPGSGGVVSKTWKNYALSRAYLDPRAEDIENVRVSPVDLCNARLNAAKGSARKEFLGRGITFLHKNAYEMTGKVTTEVRDIVKFSKMVYDYETIRIPVKITCMALDRPRVRQNSTTTGADPKPTGKKMQPTIAEAKLRVEPAKVEQMGKFLCPMELKLYGYLETIRDFTGKSIFVGPHYLSPITEIKMTKAGSRNMTATYRMDWQQMGGFAVAPNQEPKKQKLSFKFNVSNKDGKVLESVGKSVEVSCKKIKMNAPVAGDGEMTIQPTPTN
jgi:hypothetical protein